MSRANNRHSLNFECQRCGKCCSTYDFRIFVTIEDLRRWIKERRIDILKELVYDESFIKFFNTKTGIEITKKDFLKFIRENEKQGIKTEDILFLTKALGNKTMDKILNAMILEEKYLKKENRGNFLRINDDLVSLEYPLEWKHQFRCSFLKREYGKHPAKCLIHDTKPKICRNYFCERIKKESIKYTLKVN